MKKIHSTRFLLGWAFAGLLLGAVLIAISSDNFNPSNILIDADNKRDSYADAVNKAAVSVVSIQAFHLVRQKENLLPEEKTTNLDKSPQSQFKISPIKALA